MLDPLSRAETPDIPSDRAASEAGGPQPAAEAGGAVLVPGQRWRHFTVGQPLTGGHPGAFEGVESGSMEPVILYNRPLAGVSAAQRQAWERLHSLESDRLVMCIEMVEERDRLIMVYGAPPLPTLQEWCTAKNVSEEVWRHFAQQLAVILRALHAEGVAHLNLRTDTVFVDKREEEYVLVVGGLQAATMIEQPGMVPVEVNPFYAPPEAAGLYQIPAGRGLRAWDWWSLGRLVQECILRRPVYAQLLNCEQRPPGPEFRSRAEQLLLERDATGPRAGAVEAMPAGLHPTTLALLRGLLTSSRDGRWQGEEVMHCLIGEAVPDHYDLPREARLFFWRERAFTLPGLAEHFVEAGLWPEGELIIFAGPDDPTGLQHFLDEVPAHRRESGLLRGLKDLQAMPAWSAIPEEATRSAIVTLVWLALGARQGKESVACIKGHRLDTAGLKQLVKDEMPGDAVALLQAMTTEPYLQRLAALGGGAAVQLLTQVAATGGVAIQRAVREGWADPSDENLKAKLYALSLETDAELLARLEKLRAAYAGNRNPVITELMRAPRPERWSLALLGFMAGFASDYGFITHAEWNQSRYRQLKQRAEQLVASLFWHRLRRLMLANPALLGTWPMFVLFWGIPLLLAAAAESWFGLALVLGCAVAVRAAAYQFVNGELHRRAPQSAAWAWHDRPQRCLEESARSAPGSESASERALRRELDEITLEAQALPLSPRPAALPSAPRLVGLWTVATASWAVVVVLTIWIAWPLLAKPEPFNFRERLVLPARGGSPHATVTVAGATGSPEIYEEINDGFGRRMRGPLRAWDLPPPQAVEPLPVVAEEDVNPDQVAYALVSGNLLLDPYPRKGLNLMLAIRVPVDQAIGLVLLDTRQRRLVEPRMYILVEAPRPRTWYQLGDRRVVYLGEPPAMPLKNSLAPQ